MRYSEDHKQATRSRIVEAAGRRFKEDGIDGAGIAAVMSDAGLTNGAFYAHFDSKDDLIWNVVGDQLRSQRHLFEDLPDGRAGLDELIASYLSPQHRDQCAEGCPSASLLAEIGRRPFSTREAFTSELGGTVEEIATNLDPNDLDRGRRHAYSLLGLLVGTLQMARAVSSPELSDRLLADGVNSASELLDTWALSTGHQPSR